MLRNLQRLFNLIMKLFLAAAFVAVCCALSNAQNFNHYKTLLPQGLVPKNFTELSANKFATEVTDGRGEQTRSQKQKEILPRKYI
jgi:beta-barrel assembly-enhancing protease